MTDDRSEDGPNGYHQHKSRWGAEYSRYGYSSVKTVPSNESMIQDDDFQPDPSLVNLSSDLYHESIRDDLTASRQRTASIIPQPRPSSQNSVRRWQLVDDSHGAEQALATPVEALQQHRHSKTGSVDNFNDLRRKSAEIGAVLALKINSLSGNKQGDKDYLPSPAMSYKEGRRNSQIYLLDLQNAQEEERKAAARNDPCVGSGISRRNSRSLKPAYSVGDSKRNSKKYLQDLKKALQKEEKAAARNDSGAE